jgi:hypothetical protein
MPRTSTKFPLLDRLIWYLNERWSIHQKRLYGLPPPWTADATLRDYRFCEVRREDDRVTRWIHANWLRPHADDPDLWHAMYIARVYNKPETLEVMRWPEPWSKKRAVALKRACELQRNGNVVFASAYSTWSTKVIQGVDCTKTRHYFNVFDALWANRKVIQPKPGDTVRAVYERLLAQPKLGSFMANQVVADLKWGRMLFGASDFETFAASGPGSLQGLNRLCGVDSMRHRREADWHATMLEVRAAIKSSLPKELRNLDAQNMEHGLCELNKWLYYNDDGVPPRRKYISTQSTYCGKAVK